MHLATDLPFTCVTCEAPIGGSPTFHVGLPFCCAGCAADGPCICSYDDVEPTTAERPVDPHQVRYCLDLGERHEELEVPVGARR